MGIIQIEQDLADNYAAIREQRNVSWEQLATEMEPNDPLLAAWMRSDAATEAEARRGDTLAKAKRAEAARKRAEAADRQRAVDDAQLAADAAVLDSGLTTPAVAGNAVDGDPLKDAGTGEPAKTDQDILGGAGTDPTDPTNAGAADSTSTTTTDSPTQSASPASPGSTVSADSSDDPGKAGQTTSTVVGRTSDSGLSQQG